MSDERSSRPPSVLVTPGRAASLLVAPTFEPGPSRARFLPGCEGGAESRIVVRDDNRASVGARVVGVETRPTAQLQLSPRTERSGNPGSSLSKGARIEGPSIRNSLGSYRNSVFAVTGYRVLSGSQAILAAAPGFRNAADNRRWIMVEHWRSCLCLRFIQR